MFLGAVVASVIVAAPGGAAKPTYSVACTSYSITLTWPSGTIGADYTTYDGNGNAVASGHENISPKGPGSDTIDLTNASTALVSALATFTGKKIGARVHADCTA